MKYLEWNNVISEYFFKPENAGVDIYLYITKKDIIDIGRKYFEGKKDYEIWADFLAQLRYGLPEGSRSSFDLIDKANESLSFYKRWIKEGRISVDGVDVFYPTYIVCRQPDNVPF